jgi:uncharacterized protein (DUF2164 family)
MSVDKRLELTKDEREQLVVAVKDFFLNEQDQEIGDLAVILFIDFMVKKLGPAFYNRGIQDAGRFITDKLEDLAGLEIWRVE